MFSFKNMLKILLVTLLLSGVVLVSGFYSSALQYLDKPGFAQGISINGIDISGLSEEQARAKIGAAWSSSLQNAFITVTCGGKTARYSAKDAGAALKLDQAFFEISALDEGSFFKKLDTVLQLKKGMDYAAQTVYDATTMEKSILPFSNEITRAPVNASVRFEQDGFMNYTDSKTGLLLDERPLATALIQRFEAGDYSPLEVKPREIEPTITRGDLELHTSQLGFYETILAGSADRIGNISLITEAVNGVTILPGETFSLNALTGQRTPDKGYKDAPSIVNGKLIDDTGGGVCQLAGTLYNAALLSNLEITQRHHHTWPAAYLPVGQDSTISWPDKDLKIKNPSEWPVYIKTGISDGKLNVAFYGSDTTGGLDIQLENEILETYKPSKPLIEYDPSKPTTYKNVVEQERTGYWVKLYKRYYKDGILVNSELVSEDKYNPIRGKIVYGSKQENGEIK